MGAHTGGGGNSNADNKIGPATRHLGFMHSLVGQPDAVEGGHVRRNSPRMGDLIKAQAVGRTGNTRRGQRNLPNPDVLSAEHARHVCWLHNQPILQGRLQIGSKLRKSRRFSGGRVCDHEFSGADGLAKIPNKGDIAGFDRALHWPSSSLSALTPRARSPLQREMHQEKGLVGGLNGVADNRQGPFCLASSLSSVCTHNTADVALIECCTDSQGRTSQTRTAHTVPMSWNSHSQSAAQRPRETTRAVLGNAHRAGMRSQTPSLAHWPNFIFSFT